MELVIKKYEFEIHDHQTQNKDIWVFYSL